MKHLPQMFALIMLTIILSLSSLWAGTSGKIAGTVKEKGTNNPLVFASVVVLGQQLGAVTDADGNFTIIDVPPGTYQLQVTYIGYRKVKIEKVQVRIDQTTRLEIEVEPDSYQTSELVVTAERKVVKADLTTSGVSLSADEIKQLPVGSVTDVVGLQAGIQGLSIRGGSSDKMLFMVNGVTMRDPRNNEPVSSLALSAVKEISVERGGFNAEYGQVQNGLVNVVAREGDKKKYSARLEFRITPPNAKYYRGSSDIKDVSDPMSFALRPFFDEAVCWTGTTSGAWDEYTRKQYPEFVGWNEISKILNSDNNPYNDLTPVGAQRAFMYETRKKQADNKPDYHIDAGFGGPVPYFSDMLGNLRFYAAFKSTQEQLVYPLTRPDYQEYNGNLQLNADINESMKLRISGMQAKRYTMRGNWDGTGFYSYIRYPNEVANAASSITTTYDLIGLFSDFNFSISDITNQSVAAKFTHTLNATSFYEVSVEHFRSKYNTRPSALRDTSAKFEILPGFFEDSNPYGYWPGEQFGVILTGGQHVSKARDFSVVSSTTAKADINSQLNSANLFKAGVQLDLNDLNLDYGTIASATAGKNYASRVQQHVFPYRFAGYLQNKLETQEFILNVGVRFDYNSANADWYDIDPYNAAFVSSKYNESLSFPKKESEGQWQISPRVGISHPITAESKLFFNYGHFKQTPNYESMFRVQRSDEHQLTSIGNPNLILSKTISYELGYDHAFSDILLQLAAYYNDVTDQQDYTTYNTKDGVSYSLTTSNLYSDTRGFEFTIRKSMGDWITGFANYTYRVTTTGHFGSSQRYQDITQQKQYDAKTTNLYQDRPIPQPFARVNMNLFTPEDFGPEVLGHKVFGSMYLRAMFDWSEGYWSTFNENGVAGIAYNVQALDYYNLNLRFEKYFPVGDFKFNIFVDVNNVFNTLRLWNTSDLDYMRSLHLPKSSAYNNIEGNDKIGDYRKPGVEYQPMKYQSVVDRTKSGEARPIYYEGSTGKYLQYVNGAWQEVDAARMKKVLKDKAYIDMPNASTFWFLNPRNIYFGISVTFNFTD